MNLACVNRSRIKLLWGLVCAAAVFFVCAFLAFWKAGATFALLIAALSPWSLKTSEKTTGILTLLWIVAGAFVTMFATQYIYEPTQITPRGYLFLCGVLVVLALTGLLYAITLKPRASSLIASLLLMLFSTADYYVCQFRGVEIAPTDIFCPHGDECCWKLSFFGGSAYDLCVVHMYCMGSCRFSAAAGIISKERSSPQRKLCGGNGAFDWAVYTWHQRCLAQTSDGQLWN